MHIAQFVVCSIGGLHGVDFSFLCSCGTRCISALDWKPSVVATITTSNIMLRPWSVSTRVIPMIIGAAGTIVESFRKYPSSMLRNHDIEELQEAAILDTAHILRKVLIKLTQRFSCEIGFSWLGSPNGPGPHL